MKKQPKMLRFPKELLDKIESSDKIPKYMDFTSKVFLLLEQALKDETVKEPSKKKEEHHRRLRSA